MISLIWDTTDHYIVYTIVALSGQSVSLVHDSTKNILHYVLLDF